MNTKLDREMFASPPESGYLWCLHCQRTYRYGNYRLVELLQMCPYWDCDGDTVMDSVNWETIRSMHPNYPRKPKGGILYPMYPVKRRF